MGKLLAYTRVSTKLQSIQRQITNIVSAYPEIDPNNIYQEQFTGTKLDRPVFTKLMSKVRPGDTIIFDEVSRMARNAQEGFELYRRWYEMGVNLVFLKEPHINTSSYREALKRSEFADQMKVNIEGSKSTENFVNGIMKLVHDLLMAKAAEDIETAFLQAQKEVDYLHKRTSEGMRESNKMAGRNPNDRYVTEKEIKAKILIHKWNSTFNNNGMNNLQTMQLCGISHGTFYRYKSELIEELNAHNSDIEEVVKWLKEKKEAKHESRLKSG